MTNEALTELDVDGRTVVVVGGASGIGAAAATHLVHAGARVVVGDLVPTSRPHAGFAASFEVDVRSVDSVRQFFADVVSQVGVPDDLVFSVGVFSKVLTDALDDATWTSSLDVNLSAAFRTARVFKEHSDATPRRRDRSIVLVSSTHAMKVTQKGMVHYATAKAGMLGMVSALAREWGPDGIRVNAVAPTMTATDALENFLKEGGGDPEQLKSTYANELIPLGRLATSEDVARVITFLSSGWANFVSGVTLPVDGGYLS